MTWWLPVVYVAIGVIVAEGSARSREVSASTVPSLRGAAYALAALLWLPMFVRMALQRRPR